MSALNVSACIYHHWTVGTLFIISLLLGLHLIFMRCILPFVVEMGFALKVAYAIENVTWKDFTNFYFVYHRDHYCKCIKPCNFSVMIPRVQRVKLLQQNRRYLNIVFFSFICFWFLS